MLGGSMMNPNRVAAALLVLLSAATCAETHAEPCENPLGWRPSSVARSAIVSAFASHSLLAWRDDSTARCVLLNELGTLSPGWSGQGLELAAASEMPSQPQLLVLSDSFVVAAWHRAGAQGKDVSAAKIIANGGQAPFASAVIIEPLTDLAGDQTLVGLIRQDEDHALVMINASGPVTSPLVRQVARPGAPPSAWPPQGVALDDTLLGTRIVSGCDDGGTGCYVLMLRDSLGQYQLRILHLLADGSLDLLWPAEKVVARNALLIESRTALLADRSGGVYLIGWNDVAAPAGWHFGADGGLQPGWPDAGLELIPTPSGYSVSIAEGPQFAVSSTGRLIGMASRQNLLFRQEGIAAMSHEPDGASTPGWPATGLQYPGMVVQSGSPQLALTEADQIVMTWTQDTNPIGWGCLMGVALSSVGAELPGWPSEHVLCCLSGELEYTRLALGTDGAFSQLWYVSRLLPGEGAHFARFQLADGVVPTLASARLLEKNLLGRSLHAAWALDGVQGSALELLRSLDGAGFAEWPILQWQGASVIALDDELPAGVHEARYVLVSAQDGTRRALSDTLVASVREPRVMLRITGARVQRGPELQFTLELDPTEPFVELAAFDVAGRRIGRLDVRPVSAAAQQVRLRIERDARGVCLVRARPANGETVVRQFVVIP